MTVRVRYAPSPTGHLHIGGVRTALFNYFYARHYNGQFILRFEDTDLDRNVPGAEEEMLKGFRWLGVDWDEGPDVGGPYVPYRCTERLDIYRSYLQKLVDANAAYPCFCSPEELEAEREAAAAQGRISGYSGRCRHLSDEQRQQKLAEGRVPNWRFAVPMGAELAFTDLIRGDMRFQTDDIGDFVIVKSNGIPTYNFQVVIDDALMNITHVIRGEEHLSNTPKQLLVYQALGFEPATFAHLPQVLDQTRKKLSKRDPNVKPVHIYREEGYLPEAIVNFLALLGWSPGGEEEIMAFAEIVEKFDLDRVNRSGAVFDVDKLHWMAGQYMKQLPNEELTDMVQQYLDKRGMRLPQGRGRQWLEGVVALLHEKMSCVAEFPALAQDFFRAETELSQEALEVLKEDGALAVVARYQELAKDADSWSAEASKGWFKQVGAELNVKGRKLFMPVRAALTGEVHGPDLQQTVFLLQKEWVLARLDKALTVLSH